MASKPGSEHLDNLVQELRRGAIVLAVLNQLKSRHYGYSLRERLSGAGLDVHEGTLYPLLRRLETHKLLVSEWELGAGRPRRYYRLSPVGEEARSALHDEWQQLVAAIEGLAKDQ